MNKNWTPQDITIWADKTFGQAKSTIGMAARMNEEVAELIVALAREDTVENIHKEIADIYIVLSRLACYLNCDIQQNVNKKMEINVKRKWMSDGTGHGYHVKG